MANKKNLANAITGAAIATNSTTLTLEPGYGVTMVAA